MADKSVFWFRRDLRLADNPALRSASHEGPVVGLFINDERLRKPSGLPRLAFLAQTLGSLQRSMAGNLVVRSGDPNTVLLDICRSSGISSVFATADFGPYGRKRDAAAKKALAGQGISLNLLDSPYAVSPGRIVSGAGTFYKVFTPFFKAWKRQGWPAAEGAIDVSWVGSVRSESLPEAPVTSARLPAAGEAAAQEALDRFLNAAIHDYNINRDLPAIRGTSHLSAYLKWGSIHPRQILDRLGDSPSEDVFRSEICWREFYAEVLYQRPETARLAFRPEMSAMEVDQGSQADARFQLWSEGQTGYPIVDAGMRQLLATGWMHNRVRMISASFLVKDLHLDWTRGARWFMNHLVDGDLASNSHGWQWVAGTGTDASPYFRIFNPVTQSKKFDSEGAYIRHWIPELRHLPSKHIHDPWNDPHGPPAGYPAPAVDHKIERLESLARYKVVREAKDQKDRM